MGKFEPVLMGVLASLILGIVGVIAITPDVIPSEMAGTAETAQGVPVETGVPSGPMMTVDLPAEMGAPSETAASRGPVVMAAAYAVSIPAGSSIAGCQKDDACYIPSMIEAPAGQAITWTNDDTGVHTVTSGSVDEASDLFDSGLILSGDVFELAFEEAGTYDYYCIVHPWMEGTVSVSDVVQASVPAMSLEESLQLGPATVDDGMMIDDMMMQGEPADRDMMIDEPMMKDGPAKDNDMMMVQDNMMMQGDPAVSVPAGSSVPGCENDSACYIPYSLEVSSGTTVTWTNDDTAAHTVTSGTPKGGPDGIFDSSLFLSGAEFEFEFTEAGTYDYYCIVHPWMIGSVSVSEAMPQDSRPAMAEPTKEPAVSVPAGSSVPGCEDDSACYIPYSLEVPAGTTVTWTNDDTAAHTVTSGTKAAGPDGVFDSSLFLSGAEFEFEFTEAGTYDYYCIVHPWMSGSIEVY